MSDPTIAELAQSLNTKKKTIENTLYKLRKEGTDLGYIKNNKRHFTKEDQQKLAAALPKRAPLVDIDVSAELDRLRGTIDKLENTLKEEREKADIERSEMRQLLAQANSNLKQALEKNEQLTLDYNKEKNKSFFAKLFGK